MENPRVDENANNEEGTGNNGDQQDAANTNNAVAQPSKKTKRDYPWVGFDDLKLITPWGFFGYEVPMTEALPCTLEAISATTITFDVFNKVYPDRSHLGWGLEWDNWFPTSEPVYPEFSMWKRTDYQKIEERLNNFVMVQTVLHQVDKVKIKKSKSIVLKLTEMESSFLHSVQEKFLCHLEEIRF